MIVSASLEAFTKLVAEAKPGSRTPLSIRVNALSVRAHLIASGVAVSPMTERDLQEEDRIAREVEELCSGVFPLILNVAIIDYKTVHLTFANDGNLMEFALTHGEEVEMSEVRP